MSDDSDQHDIDRRRFDRYVDVIQRSDRPRPPTAPSRDRIEAKMWAAFAETEAVEPGRSDAGRANDAVVIDLATSDPERPSRYGMLAAAAAVVVVVAAGMVVLVPQASDDRTMVTSPPASESPQGVFATEVEEFCDGELPLLQNAVDEWNAAETGDDGASAAVVAELERVTSGYEDLVTGSDDPIAITRLNETMGIVGEIRLAERGLDEPEAVDEHIGTALDALSVELSTVTDSADACRIEVGS